MLRYQSCGKRQSWKSREATQRVGSPSIVKFPDLYSQGPTLACFALLKPLAMCYKPCNVWQVWLQSIISRAKCLWSNRDFFVDPSAGKTSRNSKCCCLSCQRPRCRHQRSVHSCRGWNCADDCVNRVLIEQRITRHHAGWVCSFRAFLLRQWQWMAISSSPEPRVSFNLVDFYHNESSLFGVDSLKMSFKETADILRALTPGFESGDFPAPDVQAFPLVQGSEIYRGMNEARLKRKIVLNP